MRFNSYDLKELEERLKKLKIPDALQYAILWIASDILDYKDNQNGIAENALETTENTIKEIQKYQNTIKTYRDAIHEMKSELVAWREFAEHQAWCRECGETSPKYCSEGFALWKKADPSVTRE